MNKAELIAVAKRWLQAGYSVIPVSSNKRAISAWAENQVRPYQLDQAERAFNDPRAKQVAIVAGHNGIVAFDFDPDKRGVAIHPFDIHTDYYEPWLASVTTNLGIKPAEQNTPSGGVHAIIRTQNPVGNTQLARVPAKPDEGKIQTHATIETRGAGGYFVLYDHNLDPSSIPEVSDAEFQAMLEIAAELDSVPDAPDDQQAAQKARAATSAPGKKVTANATTEGNVGWFNRQVPLEDVLKKYGYRRVHRKWLSPSSSSGNAGVTIFKDDNGLELCYSHHGDALGDGHAHDAFDTMKILEFGGIFEAAIGYVRELKADSASTARFTFTPSADSESSRAREQFFKEATNRENTVTDATTICGHPLATNGEVATKEPDLWPNQPEAGHKSKEAGNPVQDTLTLTGAKASPHLWPEGGHKQSGPSSTQKTDLWPTEQTASGKSFLQRWADRAQPPPVQWLVHHLIQDNAENLLAGEPGVGKSWISGDLAVAVATGSQFMDRHTQQGSVVIINFDDPSESLPRMFAERAARGRGYDFNELDIYYWQPDEKRPYPPEGIITPDLFEKLLEEMARLRPRLIIIDAFSSSFPNLDGNKGPDAIRAFEAMRQLRIAAGSHCCLVLIDHTPKATMQDSKRRGVSGSQQKHAKTRTVHIIRHVDPGDVNGDDVLEWEVFKANAAPRQEPFGVDRNMDSLLSTAKLSTRPLPQTGSGAMYDRAAKAAITYLRSRAGDVVQQQDLLNEVVSVANVSMRTARRGLRSNEFLDHPQVQRVELGGRGNPIAYSYEPEEGASRLSLYDQLRELVFSPQPGMSINGIDTIREAFTLAEAGDDDARDRIDAYLSREEVRDFLARARRSSPEGTTK